MPMLIASQGFERRPRMYVAIVRLMSPALYPGNFSHCRLRALGVHRRLVSARRPGRGWAAMTDSELAVARLVSQGLSNREVAERLFVSPHTVSGHLRHVFTKLDVNSRAELTRLAGLHDSNR